MPKCTTLLDKFRTVSASASAFNRMESMVNQSKPQINQEKPTSGSNGKRRKPKRWRPTPPGQKLIKGLLLTAVLFLGQALFRHPLVPVDLTLGASHLVRIEPPFQLTDELKDLEAKLERLRSVKSVEPGVFAINLDSGQYVEYNGKQPFSAASMIKVPILVSFLGAVERGECKLEDELVLREDLITNGSGFLQWQKPGTKLSARKAAQLMIIFSDNTATNLLIDLLGGPEHLNRDFHRWGLQHTKVNHLLADLEGTNTTCPYDMVYLLGRVDHGELISPESREFMYDIMAKCRNRSLLVTGLGPGASIVHKTGTIGCMVGDAGIVTTSSGTRYCVAVQVSRKRNDTNGNNLIREMSKVIYETYAQQRPPRHEETDNGDGIHTVSSGNEKIKAQRKPDLARVSG